MPMYTRIIKALEPWNVFNMVSTEQIVQRLIFLSKLPYIVRVIDKNEARISA